MQKDIAAYQMDPRSVSKDALDGATNAVAVANANLDVARKQYDLTKAGAWVYDIQNQERQTTALEQAHAASSALLGKVHAARPAGWRCALHQHHRRKLRVPTGLLRCIHPGRGPAHHLGNFPGALNVRCYVDEILVPRLPSGSKMKAQMSIRGSNVKIPLEFVRRAALRFSEDRALEPAPGTSGCPGSARDFQD